VAEEDTKLNTKKAAAEEDVVSGECVVCLDARKNRLLLPCGNLCVCEACAERIKVGDPCPICRTEVTMKHAAYI
jgi:hypothetical protein